MACPSHEASCVQAEWSRGLHGYSEPDEISASPCTLGPCSCATPPPSLCGWIGHLKVFFPSHVGQPSPRTTAILLCSSCQHARWPSTSQKLCACRWLLRGTRICLCSLCHAHKTGLLIMLQGRQHSTSGITNRWAPAKTSHTMAAKETYLSLTLLILFLLLPFLISCDLSCQL